MISQEMIDSVLEHKKNRTVVILKDFNKNVPSWDDFINYLDESANLPSPEDPGFGDYVKGNVMTKEHLYYYMFTHRQFNKTTKEIEDAMRDAFKSPGGISGVFVTFSSNIIDVRPHRDPQDNFYWQCIGSTEWVFDGQSHTVEPGDVVFIPAYADHAVNFSMPRAAISFWWELNQSLAN